MLVQLLVVLVVLVVVKVDGRFVMAKPVGVFLLSGGKDSVAAALKCRWSRAFSRCVGIMCTVRDITWEDLEYNAYLEGLLDLKISLVSIPPGGLQQFLRARTPATPWPLPISQTILHGRSLIQYARAYLKIDNRDAFFIRGLSKQDIAMASGRVVMPNHLIPLKDMEDVQILQFLQDNDVKLHPAYARGFTKHSHYPSPVWARSDLEQNMQAFKQHFPERFAYWCQWENDNNIPFFQVSATEYRWIREF